MHTQAAFPHSRCRPAALAVALATALGIALAGAVPALAETAADPTTLDTIVVTAAGFEQKLADAPASISIVTARRSASAPTPA